jgi:hypothetical protein
MKEKLHYDDKGSTFKEAFAEARAEGKKTFEWNGEKYSTKLKEKAKGPDESEAETKRLASKKDEGETRKPTNRGGAAALAGAGIGLGAAAALSGMKRAESARKERELEKNKPIRFKNPIRNISPEEAAWEGEGGSSFKKGGKVSSASSRADGIAQRGKTRGRIC